MNKISQLELSEMLVKVINSTDGSRDQWHPEDASAYLVTVIEILTAGLLSGVVEGGIVPEDKQTTIFDQLKRGDE